jgi:hypothetical protein
MLKIIAILPVHAEKGGLPRDVSHEFLKRRLLENKKG